MLEREWSVAHARRGRDGCQEGRERGYYNLHRNLNKTICLHNCELFNCELKNGAPEGATV